MTDLPAALRPWAALLALFPRDVALALGPAVRSLAVAVGPLRTRAQPGVGEPDGFDGLARRGSYERLLLSEWLLRDELPDEFARRAAMGEHGFLERRLREPASARASVALFDAGPSQLGAPRVAHLAALVVLAQRAAAGGARFAWGVLQDRARAPVREFTPAGVRVLLDGRTAHEVDPGDVSHWRELLARDGLTEDTWLVGAPPPGLLARDAGAWCPGQIVVRDVLEPGPARVAVSVRPARGSPREVTLDLPPEPVCARLIRDPFGGGAAAPVTSALRAVSNLVFCVAGNKVLARAAPDALLSVPIPATPRESAGRPRTRALTAAHRAFGQVILAAGYHRRRYWLATANAHGIHWDVRADAPLARVDFAMPPGVSVGAPDALSPCFPIEGAAGEGFGHTLVDARGTLFACHGGSARVVATGVRALAPLGAALGLVCDAPMSEHPEGSALRPATLPGLGPGLARVQLAQVVGGALRTVRVFAGDGSLRAFAGYPGGDVGHTLPYFAVHDRADSWAICEADVELARVRPDAGAEVVGVVCDDGPDGTGPALLVLGPDRRSLQACGARRTRVLVTAASEVVHVAASHAAPDVAYTTASGELVVYSLRYATALVRVLPGRAR